MDTAGTTNPPEHLFTDKVLPALLHKMRKIPLKIGVRIDPAAIVYIYKESGSLRMRSMPLRNLWPNTDVEFVIEDFRNRHGEHIEDVPDFALRKMINIIKRTKQGKTISEALKELNLTQKKNDESQSDDSIFDRLTSNIKSSKTNTNGFIDTSKTPLQMNKNGDLNVSVKKKEFPKKMTFASNLFDEIRIAESKLSPSKISSPNYDFPERDTNKECQKRPTSLEVNDFELSTSFNNIHKSNQNQTQYKKTGFLLDLEKDLDEVESQSSKKDLTPGKLAMRAKAKEKQNTDSQQQKVPKQKNEDDTDVEFDDSDNPLDEQDEDFW